MIAYKFYILSTYPSMINFYESLEILIEIIKANFNFLKEIFPLFCSKFETCLLKS